MKKGSTRRGAARAQQRYWMPQNCSLGPGSSGFPGKPPLEPTHRGRELRAWRANGDRGFPEGTARGRQESSGDLGRGSQSSTARRPSFLQPHQQSFPQEPLPRALLSPAVISVTKWRHHPQQSVAPALQLENHIRIIQRARENPASRPHVQSFWLGRPEAGPGGLLAGPVRGERTLRAPLRAPQHAASCLCSPRPSQPLQLPGRKASGCSQLSGARSSQTSN